MRVAAVQLCAGADPQANLDAAERGVREAATGGAELVVLPEKWLVIDPGQLAGQAHAYGGELHRRLAALAAELGVHLIAGSISERPTEADPDRRLFNTALHLGPGGETLARYRKIHQFDADVGGRRYRESDAERPGEAPVVSRAQAGGREWTLGLTICFDLRFSGLFAALGRAGVDVVMLPSAFTEATTTAHWESLVRARAIELGAFVIAANQAGEHPDGSRSGGQSLIAGPWGDVLARAGASAPEVIWADLDAAAVEHAREALPVFRLERRDAYLATPGDGLPKGGGAPARSGPSA